MKLKKYLTFFENEESRKIVKREGTLRFLTTIMVLIDVVLLTLAYIYNAKANGIFFYCSAASLVILGVNSYFEKRFNAVINALFLREKTDRTDPVSLQKIKCINKFEKYTAYICKSSKIIFVFTLVFAAVVLIFGILSMAMRGNVSVFVTVMGIGIILYALLQISFALASTVMENNYFDSCKAEMQLMKKNQP